jgi:TolA-binding protein
VKKFPQSPYFPKGELDLGWCLWLANRMPECQQALQTATSTLPYSTELAVAYFKLADAQFRQGNFRAAINNYETLIEKFASVPHQSGTVSNLFEPALYQEIRASLASGEMNAATNALGRILNWYPNGFHTERAVLLTGQAISNTGDPRRARTLFSGFMNVVSNSASIPDGQLAIARTYEKENDWTNAIQQYQRWLSIFTNHPARAQAEYYCACAISQTGDKTNAFISFTNFIARFPTNDLAAPAQWWVADFYYAMGAFSSAENGYQTIFTQWPKSELANQAQMMAGRAALKRQVGRDADRYFTNLCNNLNCPVDLRFQALFAHGDTLGSEGKPENYEEAMTVFALIARDYATNKLAALALGQKACYALQWAQSSTASDKYDTVSNAFVDVINSPLADSRATNIATIGLGIVLEKFAQQRPDEARKFREQALDLYVTVFLNDEQPEVFWTKFAGIEAGRLAYDMREWQKAIKIYQRLQKILPAPLPFIQNRIQDCERSLARVSKG